MRALATLCGATLASALFAACATSEEDPQRKPPGGFADAAGGTGGVLDSGSDVGATDAPADTGADAQPDASADASPDASADASGDAAQPDASAGQLILVTRSATGLVLATRTAASAFSTQPIAQAALDTPALTRTSSGALVVVRDPAAGELRYATYAKAGATLSPFAAVGTAGMTLGAPALSESGTATLAFLGTDFKYYVNRYAGSWQGFAPVLAASLHSFGPAAPSVAALPGTELVAYVGDDGKLYTQVAQAGSFQPAHAHATPALLDKAVTPSVVATVGPSPSFVLVYVEASTQRLLWTEGNASAWSTPAPVSTTLTAVGAPALAPLSNGDAVLAFRATDDRVRTSILSGGTWSAPLSPFPNSALSAPPAVAPGVGSQAELAWISGGTLLSSSLSAGGWKAATTVLASAQQTVAMATIP